MALGRLGRLEPLAALETLVGQLGESQLVELGRSRQEELGESPQLLAAEAWKQW